MASTAHNRGQNDRVGTMFARTLPGLTHYEEAALANLSSVRRFVGRNTVIAREAEYLDKLRFFVSGWAMKYVGLSEERRQIIGFVLPGNLEGLHADFRQASTTNVVTLTRCEIAEFQMTDIQNLAHDFAGIGAGFRGYMSREAAILSDQVLRLGRMTAYERVCHFLLETFDRQCPDCPNGSTVPFPITQSIVADALGLSVVHVNRQVMRLRQERLLDLDRKSLTIHDFRRLQSISGYKSRRSERELSYAGAAE